MTSQMSAADAVRSYRQPAPWGAVRFLERNGLLHAIVPELEPAAAAEAAPEPIAYWMAEVDAMLEHPHPISAADREVLFNLPRMRELSGFARSVLACVADVPVGEMLTYAEVARRIGEPHAARAVGRALALNPYPILIACHRVTSAQAMAAMDILKPETLMPEAYMGMRKMRGVGAWLRLHDLAAAP